MFLLHSTLLVFFFLLNFRYNFWVVSLEIRSISLTTVRFFIVAEEKKKIKTII